jgi:serine protease Do
VIEDGGYIMTNAHVVSGARRVQIVLPAGDADGTLATALSGKSTLVPARIVGITTELDLALLKVDDVKLPALTLATYSQVRQGETVFAFGSPIGLRNSLLTGWSRRARRSIPTRRSSTSRPTRRSTPGIPAARWSIFAAKSSASTPSSCRNRAERRSGLRGPKRHGPTGFASWQTVIRRQEVGMSLQTITEGQLARLERPGHRLGCVARWTREAAGAVGDILFWTVSPGQPRRSSATSVSETPDPRLEVMRRAGDPQHSR